MLRRLNIDQPISFQFTKENKIWAEEQIKKYPPGRQASAVIPLLWRAQEQEGWISEAIVKAVAEILQMAPVRVFEVASFYFMFHLKPVGSIAHIQVCGTTPCMLCDSEKLIEVCKQKISKEANTLSEDGTLSWEEVECLGACANAPVVQIGKDYYEDLNSSKFTELIDSFKSGEVPRPGSQTGRFSSEPKGGRTSLKNKTSQKANASVLLAIKHKDTIKRKR